jgi:hypothetical protein
MASGATFDKEADHQPWLFQAYEFDILLQV